MREVQVALKDIGIPVSMGIWKAGVGQQTAPPQYIQYSVITTEDSFADDLLRSYKTYVYMSLWSESDPTDMASLVREKMYAAGFSMVEQRDGSNWSPTYDEKTDQFSVQWTWMLITYRGDEDAAPSAGI